MVRARPPDSIRNDRRLLCQPVCQHRTPGRQLSEYPTAVSVLVPLIRSIKKKKKKQQNEEVPQKGGRRNFETWKKKIPHSPAQPSPTEKQKLKSRQPLSPSLLQPGDARGPQKQPQSSESPRKDLGGAVHQQPSREIRERDSARSGQEARMRRHCLPAPAPALRGRSPIPQPQQSNQHTVLQGPGPRPRPS